MFSFIHKIPVFIDMFPHSIKIYIFYSTKFIELISEKHAHFLSVDRTKYLLSTRFHDMPISTHHIFQTKLPKVRIRNLLHALLTYRKPSACFATTSETLCKFITRS